MSSFSDINHNKSIKSSLQGGAGPNTTGTYGYGSTLPSSLSINNGGIGTSMAAGEERKKSQFFKN
jgi:hypothetical protein